MNNFSNTTKKNHLTIPVYLEELGKVVDFGLDRP
jgi:hypothetical protein